jgi:hypothetical protein
MAGAIKRGISYREALKNKQQYADVMAELTQEEEEKQEEKEEKQEIPTTLDSYFINNKPNSK